MLKAGTIVEVLPSAALCGVFCVGAIGKVEPYTNKYDFNIIVGNNNYYLYPNDVKPIVYQLVFDFIKD